MKKCFYGFMIGLFLIPSLCFAGIHDDVCRSEKTSTSFILTPDDLKMSDGPFGANMGDSPEKYCIYTNKPVDYYENIYTIHAESMPKTHSIFKDYYLYFFKYKGLFKIEAINNFQELKTYEKLKIQLQGKYGEPTDSKVDKFLGYSSIYSSIWENVNSGDIARIELELRSNTLSLIYTFKNKIESDALRDKADTNAL